MDAPPPPAPAVREGRPAGRGSGASAVTVLVLVLLAGGGAAASPDGLLVGLPSFGVVALGAAAGLLVWFSGVRGLAGFWVPAAAALIGAFFLPGSSPLLLFSGPPLFAFAAAGVVLAATAFGKIPPRFLLMPAFLGLFAFVSYEVQTRVGPDGDEPQYLMIAQSLLRDQDLALEADFQERRYAEFFSRPLAPDFRIRGPEGQIYSLHAVGLAILILPAYAVGGYAGASFFMAFLAALLVRELRRLVMDMCGDASLAEGVAWLVGLSPPVVHYAGLIFTEIPAALLLCVGLRTAIFGRSSRSVVAAFLCASALPWLNVRYAILAVAVGIAVLVRAWREGGLSFAAKKLALPALVPAASAVVLGLYHHALWGFFDPRRVYGRRREFSLDVLPEGLPGLFFDQEFGLFAYAPLFVLCVPGFVYLWRRERALFVAAAVAVVGVIATASVWPMWRGGFNPPARFLVPLVSILAATLALTLKRGVRPATALLMGWSVWCGLGGAMNIETVHRDRDGVAPFFRTQSGAREWTAVLPSFVLQEDMKTRGLAVPWAILLALPAAFALRSFPAATRPIRNSETLLVALALMATATYADRATSRIRQPERDAARLLGLPALHLPSMRFQDPADAAWRSGLFYEPHRSPTGLTLASDVELEAGRYSILLSTSDRVQQPPALLIRDRRKAGSVRAPMTIDPDGLRAEFEVGARGEYELALEGGEPFSVTLVRLSAGR
jgi:hypothetical protein